MGPSIILDKSAFQALSYREHLVLARHFMHNVTPVLLAEVLGDLTKQVAKGRGPKERVQDLARKVSSANFNLTYHAACTVSLLGAHFPLDGRILPENCTTTPDGYLIDSVPLSSMVGRWARGTFTETEVAVSDAWRSATRTFSLEQLRKVLERNRVLLPQPKDPESIVNVVDELLEIPGLQRVWLEWIVEDAVPESLCGSVHERWRVERFRWLRDFAPFAFHCVRVLLALAVAVRHRHLKWDPTHRIDAQYLCYLPFCMVFSSDDHVHRLLAPQLLTRSVQFTNVPQRFVPARELKSGLREFSDDVEQLDPDRRRRREFALGSYPAFVGTGLVNKLWRRYYGSWPGSGNRAVSLTSEEQALALSEANDLVRNEPPLEADGG